MKKKGLGALAVWMVVLIAGLACTFGFGWKPLLGLDLQGGLSATLIPKDGTHPSNEAVSEAATIIRRRVDGLGIAEPEVMRSDKTVVVQLPGLKSRTDQDRAKKIIGTTAKLQFHQVLMDLGPAAPTTSKVPPTTVEGAPATTGKSATSSVPPTSAPPTTAKSSGARPTSQGPAAAARGATPISFHLGDATTATTVAPPTTVAPATTAAAGKSPSAATTVPVPSVPPATAPSPQEQLAQLMAQHPGATVVSGDGGRYLLGPVLFDGTVLSSADSQLDTQSSEWEVNVKVKGADKSKVNKVFNECFTGSKACPAIRSGSAEDPSARGAVAMVLDGAVISAPSVNALDLPKNPRGFVISGSFTHKTANELALQLRYGALPVEFQPATLETVSATLGASSLHAGLVAGFVGLGLVALYMLVFYRLLGLVAILSLGTSTGFLWIIISYLGAHNGLALTLAGITGIIVSIGVAVDSNVVFYEHLREDMTKGRTLRGTVHSSFGVAWKTILSADFVSLIGAVILYLLTVGSVRGFAFYLGLSTLTDLLASWFFMRPVTIWLASRERFNRSPGLLGVRAHSAGAASVRGHATKEAPV